MPSEGSPGTFLRLDGVDRQSSARPSPKEARPGFIHGSKSGRRQTPPPAGRVPCAVDPACVSGSGFARRAATHHIGITPEKIPAIATLEAHDGKSLRPLTLLAKQVTHPTKLLDDRLPISTSRILLRTPLLLAHPRSQTVQNIRPLVIAHRPVPSPLRIRSQSPNSLASASTMS